MSVHGLTLGQFAKVADDYCAKSLCHVFAAQSRRQTLVYEVLNHLSLLSWTKSWTFTLHAPRFMSPEIGKTFQLRHLLAVVLTLASFLTFSRELSK